jgi:hypothetical protein
MQYILTGFTHNMGFREFAFEGVGEDRVRTAYRVRADLGLIKRYGIRMQELPLLCRGILERRTESEPQRAFTYSEADMGQYASLAATRTALAQKRKAPRRPTEAVGAVAGSPTT